jgi:hypothetical protein
MRTSMALPSNSHAKNGQTARQRGVVHLCYDNTAATWFALERLLMPIESALSQIRRITQRLRPSLRRRRTVRGIKTGWPQNWAQADGVNP